MTNIGHDGQRGGSSIISLYVVSTVMRSNSTVVHDGMESTCSSS